MALRVARCSLQLSNQEFHRAKAALVFKQQHEGEVPEAEDENEVLEVEDGQQVLQVDENENARKLEGERCSTLLPRNRENICSARKSNHSLFTDKNQGANEVSVLETLLVYV